jgi:hypothetical protein
MSIAFALTQASGAREENGGGCGATINEAMNLVDGATKLESNCVQDGFSFPALDCGS